MACYAIGDIQGCYDELQALLIKINFNRQQDTLWFTGDLVNRGPKSLETLRFIAELGSNAITVLGNHDLYLLAVAQGLMSPTADDTLEAILRAPDRDHLLNWLAQQPLIHVDKEQNYVLVHAGIPPCWDLATAVACAHELEAVLKGGQLHDFLQHMEGNSPDKWSDELQGMDRLRYIANALTRLRFCHADGSLEMYSKQSPTAGGDLIPWFSFESKKTFDQRIIFGHWAALNATADNNNYFALDSGCVWGNCLTAMRLEDQQRFTVNC